MTWKNEFSGSVEPDLSGYFCNFYTLIYRVEVFSFLGAISSSSRIREIFFVKIKNSFYRRNVASPRNSFQIIYTISFHVWDPPFFLSFNFRNEY